MRRRGAELANWSRPWSETPEVKNCKPADDSNTLITRDSTKIASKLHTAKFYHFLSPTFGSIPTHDEIDTQNQPKQHERIKRHLNVRTTPRHATLKKHSTDAPKRDPLITSLHHFPVHSRYYLHLHSRQSWVSLSQNHCRSSPYPSGFSCPLLHCQFQPVSA